MTFRIDLTAAILAVLFGGTGQARCQSPSELWRVTSNSSPLSEEIQFANGGARLKGTVYLPRTGTRLPAMGVAVLAFDRRGNGQSSGDLDKADYETLADDAIAGQHALSKFSRVDPRKIGFWGLSQGGWRAVLAAGRSKDAAFAISVSAPLVTANEQMEFATRNLLRLRGYPETDVRTCWLHAKRGSGISTSKARGCSCGGVAQG